MISSEAFEHIMAAHGLDGVEQLARYLAHKAGRDPNELIRVHSAAAIEKGEPPPPFRPAWTWYRDEASEMLGDAAP